MTALRRILNRLGQRLVLATAEPAVPVVFNPAQPDEVRGEMLCSTIHPSVGHSPRGLRFKAMRINEAQYEVRAYDYEPLHRLSVPGVLQSRVICYWGELPNPQLIGTYSLDDSLHAIRQLENQRLQARSSQQIDIWRYNTLGEAEPANLMQIAAARGVTVPNPFRAPELQTGRSTLQAGA